MTIPAESLSFRFGGDVISKYKAKKDRVRHLEFISAMSVHAHTHTHTREGVAGEGQNKIKLNSSSVELLNEAVKTTVHRFYYNHMFLLF